jgi:hypothetical protein
MRWALTFLLSALLAACTSASVLNRGPTGSLVLRPRAGYIDKLTNRRCTEFKHDTCLAWDTAEYDIAQADTRKLLRDLKFICNVQGERFAICENSRGLCQLKQIQTGTWPFRKTEIVLSKYLSLHSNLDFLIAANTYCASFDSTVGRAMFP